VQRKEDLRIVKTKKNLYSGLMKLMGESSFEDIKVSDICKVSLVNRSTFYDHFSDKYELLDSLIADLEAELTDKLELQGEFKSAKEYYMLMIATLFQHISDNILIYCILRSLINIRWRRFLLILMHYYQTIFI